MLSANEKAFLWATVYAQLIREQAIGDFLVDAEFCADKAIEKIGERFSKWENDHLASIALISWNNVNEKMPDPMKRVLASDGVHVREAHVNHRGNWEGWKMTDDTYFGEIINWRELPMAPLL